MPDKKIVLFGAGKYGKEALEHYGEDNVAFYVDNNCAKAGTEYNGKKVLAFSEFIPIADKYHVIISSLSYVQIAKQLEEYRINNFSIFIPFRNRRFYPGSELVITQFRTERPNHSENEYNKYTESIHAKSDTINRINKYVDTVIKDVPLFRYVEIETVNRCNGICEFCPINRHIDTREEMWMSDELLECIINQLKDIGFNGTIALFSNNEPFLDDKLPERCRYVKQELPSAFQYLFTNGTLLTLNKFIDIIDYLDELIIDNYTSNGRLLKTCTAIKGYIEKERPELSEKVTIIKRNPKEVLGTRGGDAPNRQDKISYGDIKCAMPFHQLIIRPDGKVSLCCNDPLGKCTLGDLTKDSIPDVWYGKEFTAVRNAISLGRANFWHCKYCDYFRI